MNVTVLRSKRPRPTNNSKTRVFSCQYHLPKSTGCKVRVCKSMFLSALGIRSDGRLISFLRNLQNPVFDHRGRNRINTQKIRKAIQDHIESYHPQISHYTRKHAPRRRYLDPSLTIRQIYLNYKSNPTNPALSYESFVQNFREARISFGLPRADICEKCAEHKLHQPSHNKDPIAIGNCQQCNLHRHHSAMASTARTHYMDEVNTDFPADTAVFAVDMQKVLLIPQMKYKSCFFTSRLVCFNETFACISGGPHCCILWHEAISGRCGVDVTSAFSRFLESYNSDIRNYVFWLDNCCAQNKNWILYSALMQLVNQETGPDTITFKYLERGHTFMRADVIHGSISKKLTRAQAVYDFPDLVAIIQGSISAMSAVQMRVQDFRLWTSLRTSKSLKISNIRCAQFRNGSCLLFYKYDFNAPTFCSAAPFLQISGQAPHSRTEARGFNAHKREEIIKTLLPLMPEAKHSFWKNLAPSTEPDLCRDFE